MTDYLKYWLYFAGFLRLFGAYNGYFQQKIVQKNVYGAKPTEVTKLQGRTFAVWTLASLGLCIACAAGLQSNGTSSELYAVTFYSFILALGHFVLETFVHGTSTVRNALPPFIIASTSLIWMWLQWDYYVAPKDNY
eukprot:GEZU01016177.1.p1 GENE.GEZU01016177.1~~GEZU01016177.1.p1  ORF type:complete len:136 (+),score=28.18 GEZU01016177.1:202-609(+)